MKKIIVFFSTALTIIPAFTMKSDPAIPLEEFKHNSECTTEEEGPASEPLDQAIARHLRNAIRAGKVNFIHQFLINPYCVEQRVDRKTNKTMLMFAAECGNTEICQLLLEYGADPNTLDNDGKTALDFCKEKTSIWNMLKDAGGQLGPDTSEADSSNIDSQVKLAQLTELTVGEIGNIFSGFPRLMG